MTILPADNGVRATEAPWYLGGLPVRGRRKTGPGETAGADHMLKGGREPQPSGERVDGLAVKQPPARRVGALLELEGDTHRPGLVHTGQHRSGGGGPRHGATVVLCRPSRAGNGGAQGGR